MFNRWSIAFVLSLLALTLLSEPVHAQRRGPRFGPRTGPVPLAPGATFQGPVMVDPAPYPFAPGPFVPVEAAPAYQPGNQPPTPRPYSAGPLLPTPDPAFNGGPGFNGSRQAPLAYDLNQIPEGARAPSGRLAPIPMENYYAPFPGPRGQPGEGVILGGEGMPPQGGPAWQLWDGHNLQFIISEKFLNRFVARQQVQPGEIQDYILGAQVSGQQTTFTNVMLDLIPCETVAQGRIVLKGQIETQTTGVTDRAIINSAGHNEFVAIKDLEFTGKHFATRHAAVFVRAENRTLDAQTPLTGGLFGNLANRIAFRAAESRRPEAEAIARQRVAEQVYPKFDGDIDQKLAEANRLLLDQVQSRLKSSGLQPAATRLATTHTAFQFAALLTDAQAPETVPAPSANWVTGAPNVAILMHESLFNAALRKADFRGFRTTSSKLKALAARFAHLFPGEVLDDEGTSLSGGPSLGGNFGGSGGSGNALEDIDIEILFDENEPLVVGVTDDAVRITFRGTFKPAGQEFLPPLEITIPLKLEDTGDHLVLTSGASEVKSLDKNGPSFNTRAVETLVRQAIDSSLPKVQFTKRIPQKLWTVDNTPPTVREVLSRDGWLAVVVD